MPAAPGQTQPQGRVRRPPSAETMANQKAMAPARSPSRVSRRTWISAPAVSTAVSRPKTTPSPPPPGRVPVKAGRQKTAAPARPSATPAMRRAFGCSPSSAQANRTSMTGAR